MKFIKKWGTLIVAVVLLIVIAILVILGLGSIKKYKGIIAEQQASIDNMSSFIDNDIGQLVDCFVVNKSVRVGDFVTDDLLTPVQIPEKIAYAEKPVQVEVTGEDGKVTYEEQMQRSLTVVTNKNDIIGKKFKVDLSEGALVSDDYILDEVLENDQRLYQIVLEQYPTDIKQYDYIDIRIRFTYGEDFIALPHKRVENVDLGSGFFTFVFNENEINTYNSMLLDYAMYDGVLIYALRYLDTESQTAAESFYPLNNNIDEMLKNNTQILSYATAELKLKREKLNSMMGGTLEDFDDRELSNVQNSLNQYRNSYSRNMTGIIQTRVREEAEAAKRAANGY